MRLSITDASCIPCKGSHWSIISKPCAQALLFIAAYTRQAMWWVCGPTLAAQHSLKRHSPGVAAVRPLIVDDVWTLASKPYAQITPPNAGMPAGLSTVPSRTNVGRNSLEHHALEEHIAYQAVPRWRHVGSIVGQWATMSTSAWNASASWLRSEELQISTLDIHGKVLPQRKETCAATIVL